MNRLDQAIRLLKEQERSLESDKREIEKAQSRINKALAAMGVKEGDATPNRTYKSRGPVRRDTYDIVLAELTRHVTDGATFTRSQAVHWCGPEYRPADPLRDGQVHGAVRKLTDLDFITLTNTRGLYRLGGQNG